jgi:hypothetical protein
MADTESEDERKKGRFRRLGRRILGDLDEGKPIRLEAREALGAILEGGDRVKTELVRAIAREVRAYIEEFGLKEDLHSLLTNYSLEFHASFSLKRLSPTDPKSYGGPGGPPGGPGGGEGGGTQPLPPGIKAS